MIKRIFLDLDGVIRDWNGGVFKYFHLKPKSVPSWSWITDYVCEQCNISVSDFWEELDYEFWSNLDKFPWFDEVMSMISFEKTIILTSPSQNAAGGSQAWIKNNLPDYFYKKKYLIGPAKYACANPDSLLIDDSGKNCRNFMNPPDGVVGGHTILFPRSWNENAHIKDSVKYLREELLKWNGI